MLLFEPWKGGLLSVCLQRNLILRLNPMLQTSFSLCLKWNRGSCTIMSGCDSDLFMKGGFLMATMIVYLMITPIID